MTCCQALVSLNIQWASIPSVSLNCQSLKQTYTDTQGIFYLFNLTEWQGSELGTELPADAGHLVQILTRESHPCQKHCSHSPLCSVKSQVQLQLCAIVTAAALLVQSLRNGSCRDYTSITTPKSLFKCGAGSTLRNIFQLAGPLSGSK